MPTHPILVSVLVALLTLYIAAAVTSFVGGQRLLHELRTRFPSAYLGNGEPSYLAFGPLGRNYWRPVAARNFFSDRRYAGLPDADFIARADRVRAWQRISEYATWLACGAAVVTAFMRR